MGISSCSIIRAALALVVIVIAGSGAARAQEKRTDASAPLETAFENFERDWLAHRVPDWRPGNAPQRAAGVYTSALTSRRNVAVGPDATGVRYDRQPGLRKAQSPGQWRQASRPADGFANGFDAFGNPAVGPVDIQAEARNYVKQQIISGILSKTALGRSLGLFIDSGDRTTFDTRSHLIPFISPKVNARAGKASVALVWKF